MDLVTIDPAAEDNGLASMLHGLLAENLEASASKRRDFRAIRTVFGVRAPDAEVAVTLRFHEGRCTIEDGLRPDAAVVVTADSEKIPSLSLLELRYGLPWLINDAGKQFVTALVLREIKIGGLVDLPIPRLRVTLRRALDLLRLTRVLSVTDG